MRFNHGDARVWVLAMFVAVAGLAVYRLIPHYRLASGTVTAGIIVLMVIKHVGLVSVFGAPGFAYSRALIGRLRRRAVDR